MPLTNIEAVRLRCGDTDATAQIFTDPEIEYFLTANSDDVLLAAANALRAIAASTALIAKALSTGTFSLDRKNVPASLLAVADALQTEAESAPGFAVAELSASSFQTDDILATSDVTPEWRG